MNKKERIEVMRRLMAMTATLRAVIEVAEEQAKCADAADAKGLALSLFMVRESLAVYSEELTKYVKKYVGRS